ncbi:GNAT family N-acetyltransferase [Methylobacterium gossipiicola]|uniref:GNAT family N-acetyltransferase n=1 Tax=Methylobacterium gossipiicola TaxID=582675 RepID=UPI001160CB6D|nr:GNAT family N-acetyltransferase [Methylobacterium gossipiicola]
MPNAGDERREPSAQRRKRRPVATSRPAKPSAQRETVSADAVRLVATKGTKGRGGGRDGEAWRIELDGQRAGQVFINLIDQPPIGPHASIQIYLNRASQGRGIGTIGYGLACAASRYDVIYAHMQKSNTASARAAAAAGFVDETPAEERQKVMVWRRCAAAT